MTDDIAEAPVVPGAAATQAPDEETPAPPGQANRVTLASPYAAAAVPPRRRGLGLLGTVLVAAVVAAIVGAFAGIAGFAMGRALGTEPVAEAAAAPVAVAARAAGGSVAQIAEQTLPAVVSIAVEGESGFGSGSGFIIRADGYILTNNHVVSVASSDGLEVVFPDGDRRPAELVGTSVDYDLAVVKVDRTGLPTLTLGDSDGVRVGDEVVAIGAPLGLDGTVTSGIVSVLDRPVLAGENAPDESFINAVQTDAAINPGNSGGPLLDMRGNVIGVNSAIATLAIGGEAGNIGLGFAIPSNSASRVADEIIATGASRTPLMGVTLDKRYTEAGALVGDVTASGGADVAGLKPGDIVVSVDGRPIQDATELVVTIRSYAPGDTISVEFERDGDTRTVELVLGDGSKQG